MVIKTRRKYNGGRYTKKLSGGSGQAGAPVHLSDSGRAAKKARKQPAAAAAAVPSLAAAAAAVPSLRRAVSHHSAGVEAAGPVYHSEMTEFQALKYLSKGFEAEIALRLKQLDLINQGRRAADHEKEFQKSVLRVLIVYLMYQGVNYTNIRNFMGSMIDLVISASKGVAHGPGIFGFASYSDILRDIRTVFGSPDYLLSFILSGGVIQASLRATLQKKREQGGKLYEKAIENLKRFFNYVGTQFIRTQGATRAFAQEVMANPFQAIIDAIDTIGSGSIPIAYEAIDAAHSGKVRAFEEAIKRAEEDYRIASLGLAEVKRLIEETISKPQAKINAVQLALAIPGGEQAVGRAAVPSPTARMEFAGNYPPIRQPRRQTVAEGPSSSVATPVAEEGPAVAAAAATAAVAPQFHLATSPLLPTTPDEERHFKRQKSNLLTPDMISTTQSGSNMFTPVMFNDPSVAGPATGPGAVPRRESSNQQPTIRPTPGSGKGRGTKRNKSGKRGGGRRKTKKRKRKGGYKYKKRKSKRKRN